VLWQAHVVFAPDLDAGVLFSRFAHDVVLLAGAALCVWAGQVTSSRRERRAWLLIGAAVAAWTFGEIYYTAVLWTADEIPIPSPADAGYLLFAPLMLAGVVALLRSRARDVPGTLWADGITAALAVSAASAALVFDTVQENASGQALEVAANLAYPLTDLVLIGVIVGALAGTGWRLDRTWVLLFAGVATFWLADSLYLVGNANGTYEPGSWFDAGWWIGLFLIGCAAWQPARPAPVVAADERLRRIVVPLCFGTSGLALLVYGCLAGLNPVAVGLAAASLLAVMVRTMLTFADNVAMLRASREEAQTDALTGLGNRRALAKVLERELPGATAADPLVLVLFDLDGFKTYNDTFGHPAGDSLLTRMAHRLQTELARHASAYRMGGDEFCVLSLPDCDDHDAIAGLAIDALTEHGEGFQVTASHGSVTLPAEAATATEALREADRRMYARKSSNSRSSAGRQSADVLLRILSERNRDLGVHLDEVTTLADAVADSLGLPDEERAPLLQAASLHDVGKAAIPDEILNKQGPLDEAEWEFMRRHTLIGERIAQGAPALVGVAGLIRSSHERWDGHGYPDGLAGDAIPLGAQILFVCDSFSAMTSDRCYKAGLSEFEAIEELRRNAGTQFAPAVVEAFVASRAEPAARAA
jgi:two-component system, cell cycle response regulator